MRDAPSTAALVISSTAAFLTGAALAPLFLTAFDTLLALLSSWHGTLVFYGPLARWFSSGFYDGLHSPWYLLSIPTIALLSIALALFVVYAWPSEQTLATKLFVDGLAMSLVVFGCIAPSMDGGNMRSLEARFGASPLLCSILFAALGAGTLLIIERQSNQVLTNVFKLTSLAQRVALWSRRLLPPGVILVILCALNGYREGILGWLIALTITLLEDIGHRPEYRFERLEKIHLREATYTMPMIAVAALTGSVLLFGFDGSEVLRARGIVVADGHMDLLPLRIIASRYAPASDPPAINPHPSPTPLDIHWTRKPRQ